MHALYIDRHAARPLRTIDHKKDSPFLRQRPDLQKRHPAARHIRCRGDNNQLRIRADRLFDIRRGDQPLSVRANDRLLDSAFFQRLERPQYGIMLHAGRDHMITGPQYAL